MVYSLILILFYYVLATLALVLLSLESKFVQIPFQELLTIYVKSFKAPSWIFLLTHFFGAPAGTQSAGGSIIGKWIYYWRFQINRRFNFLWCPDYYSKDVSVNSGLFFYHLPLPWFFHHWIQSSLKGKFWLVKKMLFRTPVILSSIASFNIFPEFFTDNRQCFTSSETGVPEMK